MNQIHPTRVLVLALLLVGTSAFPSEAQTRTTVREAMVDADGDGRPDRRGEEVVLEGTLVARPVPFANSDEYGHTVVLEDRTGVITLYTMDNFLGQFERGDVLLVRGEVSQYGSSPYIGTSAATWIRRDTISVPPLLPVAQLKRDSLVRRRVHAAGRIVRLGAESLDRDFGIMDETGTIPLELTPRLVENTHFIQSMLEPGSANVTGILRSASEQSQTQGGVGDDYVLQVLETDDIIVSTDPRYGLILAALAALATAMLVFYLNVRRSVIERRAREIADISNQLHRRDAVMKAVSFAAERFLKASDWEESLQQALARLGEATGVSHIILLENATDKDGRTISSPRGAWADSSIESALNVSELRAFRFADAGLGRWEERFLRNDHIESSVVELPAVERSLLEAADVRSILAIPIRVYQEWWGVLAFLDTSTVRTWVETEREALSTAADIIGASIQRQRDESALRESEARFHQIASHIDELIWMSDNTGKEILYVSPAYESMWGRSRAELIDNPQSFLEAVVPEDRQILIDDLVLSRTGGGADQRQLVYRIERPDGGVRWIQSRIFRIFNEQGEPSRVMGISSDITEARRAEEEARRTNRLEAIGHLAAGIAHEINTPVQYVGDNIRFLEQSYSELGQALALYAKVLDDLRAGTLDPEEIESIATAIERLDIGYILEEAPSATHQALDGVGRVAEIVRAMREFSHPGTGQKMPTDLNRAIASTTTVARNEWKYVADLVLELDPLLPLVPCLPGEVNQAILNLVVNAAQAIGEAGEGQEDGHGKITISTSSIGDSVQIRVADTGTGIPEDVRERIFDPFFTTKPVGKGTGQGLTFVHAIVVEKHGGTIVVETSPGAGTTFIVTLPASDTEAEIDEAA